MYFVLNSDWGDATIDIDKFSAAAGAADTQSSLGRIEDTMHTKLPRPAAWGAAAARATCRRRPRQRTQNGARGREEKSQRTSEPLEDARKSPEEPLCVFGRAVAERSMAHFDFRSWKAARTSTGGVATAASPAAYASSRYHARFRAGSPAQLNGAELRAAGFDGTLRAACGATLPLSDDDNLATLGRLLAGFEQAGTQAATEAKPRDIWKIATCNANAWSSARAALQAVDLHNIDFTMLQELRIDSITQAATATGQAAADGYRLSLSLAVRTDKEGPLANSGGMGLASPRHVSARPSGRGLEQITADLRRQASADGLTSFPTDAWFGAHIFWRTVSGILKGGVLILSVWTIPGIGVSGHNVLIFQVLAEIVG